MSTPDQRFFDLLHHDTASRAPGEPYSPPIVSASMFAIPGDPAPGQPAWQYGRFGNPSWGALEDSLAVLEDAPVAIFPSGMAAVAAVFYALLKSGDRVLLPADGYFTTRVLAERFLAPLGVAVETCATREVASRDFSGLRLVWLETPSNPGLDLADIAAAAARAHAAGALLVVDNTTMTPLGQRPLDLGADLVVSSDTKAINGHSDVVAGHVAARDAALMAAVRDWRRIAGAIPGAFEAWLVHRGLETLELRWQRMNDNALALAQRFSGHPKLKALTYPGLPGHPAHQLARRQMRGFGPLIGLELADRDAAERFIHGAGCLRTGTSFGGVHSSAERRARWGDAVPAGYVRLSVGCEPFAPLAAALIRALDAA